MHNGHTNGFTGHDPETKHRRWLERKKEEKKKEVNKRTGSCPLFFPHIHQ